MKYNFRKAWIFVLSMIVALSAAIFAAACSMPTYTLRFVMSDGSEITSVTDVAGAEIKQPADPQQEGYRFIGWYTAPENGEEAKIPSVMPEENLTYYAVFEPLARGTLTLDAGEGTLEEDTYQLFVGKSIAEFVENIKPVAKEGATFVGWYYQNKELSDSLVMSANGIKLTAKYQVEYSIEVYLLDLDGETYVKDSELSENGLIGFLGDTVDAEIVAPEKYYLNRTLSKSITLAAGENICKVYFDRYSYNVFYFDGAPSGTTAEGSVEDLRGVVDGKKITVSENGFSIEGYRFAGWSLTMGGAVAYQPGDEITIDGGHIMLYARWNYGMKNVSGGSDTIYVLAEKADTVLLERRYQEDKEGVYDEETRSFEFTTDSGARLIGKVNSAGTNYVYYSSVLDRSFTYYDWESGRISDETLTLDGIDGAVYKRGDSEIIGVYELINGDYYFVSEDGSFYFQLGTYTSNGNITYIFLLRGETVGSYRYLDQSTGRIYNYPAVTFDGFGGVRMAFSSTSSYSGTYQLTEDGFLEATFEDGDDIVNYTFKAYTVTTTSNQEMDVFLIADNARGSHSFSMKGSEGVGTMTLTLDGFGNGTYTYRSADGSNDSSDSIIYSCISGYSENETEWQFIRFMLGSDIYTVRFDVTGTEAASLVGNEAGVYAESNAKSSYTARIRLFGNGNAVVEFLMQDQSYSALIEGQYVSVGDTGYDYIFTATGYSDMIEGAEDLLSPYYGKFTFRMYNVSNSVVFVTSDGVEQTYTFTIEEGENKIDYTFACNGFGYAVLKVQGSESGNTVAYSVISGYGQYRFLSFAMNNYTFCLRVAKDTERADLFTGTVTNYYDLNNRISDYTEYMTLYPDGHATISVLENGVYNTVVEGIYESVEGVNGRFTFIAQSYAEGRQSEFTCYGKFSFTYGTAASQPVFFFYNESEVLSFGDTLSLDGYGLATYKGTQYLYQLSDTEIVLTNVSGSVRITIRRNANTITEPDQAQGTYYSYLLGSDNTYLIGQYRLVLDGYKGATLWESGTEGYIQIAAGDYIINEDGDYTVTFATGELSGFSFIVGTRTVDGVSYPVYVMEDTSLIKDYEMTDGGALHVDGYGNAVYTDAEGNRRTAIYRESDDTVIEGRRVLLVIVYNQAGTGLEAIYSYIVTGINEQTRAIIVTPSMQSGKYVWVENGKINAEITLILDGLGNAQIVKYNEETGESNVIAAGKYQIDEESGAWKFVSETQGVSDFIFRTTTVTTSDGNRYSAYLKYEKTWDVTLYSDDWQVISLNGYGVAVLVDFNGNVYTVNYIVADDNTICLFGGDLSGAYYFTVNLADHTFSIKVADNTENAA